MLCPGGEDPVQEKEVANVSHLDESWSSAPVVAVTAVAAVSPLLHPKETSRQEVSVRPAQSRPTMLRCQKSSV